MKQVARELGVRYVLEGSVRRSGSRVRVTAQLIDAETGNHIWAERYDRGVDDVFAVQDEITTAVTTAIHPAVADAELRRVLAQAAREPRCMGGVSARPLACVKVPMRPTMNKRSSIFTVPSHGMRVLHLPMSLWHRRTTSLDSHSRCDRLMMP